MKKKNHIIILLIITFFVGLPLFSLRSLNGHDAIFHFFRNYGTKLAILDHQLIPMVNPVMMNGLGYAPNIFYGVLPSYIITFISLFSKSFGLAINIFIWLMIFLSGYFMYNFMYALTKDKKISIVSSIIYIVMPYHLYDIYVRMAFGEIVSFAFIPLLFYGIYNVIYEDKTKWYYITISTSILMLTHLLSSLMVGVFAFLYLILNIKKVGNKECIKKIILSLFLALLISLPTIIPFLEAKFSSDYMVFDNIYMKTNGQYMQSHAINLLKGFSLLSCMSYLCLLFTIIIITRYICLKKENKFWQFSILGIISFILTLNIIPWSILPNIFSVFQYSWRMYMMSAFLFSIVIPIIFKEKNLIYIPLCLLLLLSTPYLYRGFKNKRIDNSIINNNAITLRVDICRSPGTASAEYLPRNAIYNYEYLKNYKGLNIIEGRGIINKFKKNGTHISSKVECLDNCLVELPFIYYPGYIVKINSKEVKNFETINGLVGINMNKGNYEITTYYRGTYLMIIAYLTSLITTFILIAIINKNKRKYD